MKKELSIIYETEAKDDSDIKIKIKYSNNQSTSCIAEDRGILCEALVSLIRVEKTNEKQVDALRLCIEHLGKGLVDETYNVKKS